MRNPQRNRNISLVLSLLAPVLLVLGSGACSQSLPATDASAFHGRIAVSADGNLHDRDDWGATPATLAILAEAGLQERLVHYDFNSHLGTSDPAWEQEMRISALEGAARFGFDRNVFFDDQRSLAAAIENLRAAVDASTAEDPLFLVVAGPFEVAWRAVSASSPERRQHVTVISHSVWNNTHDNERGDHTLEDVMDLGVGLVQLPDQNHCADGCLNTEQDWAVWAWMRTSDDADLRWVHTRMEAVMRADISDSGMAYYLVTGDDESSAAKLAAYLD